MNIMPLRSTATGAPATRHRQQRRAHRPEHPLGVLLLGLALAPLAGATPTLQACVDFGCQSRQSVTLSETDWQRVQHLFQSASTPAAERAAIAQAIALLEQQVGRVTDTWQDLARNWQRAGEPGELDCIAESRNTSHYIAVLEQAGLLRWHRNRPRVQRGFFINVHWTAVVEQQSDGHQWAVDSWFRDNGQPAVILPLEQWYQRKEPTP